MPMTSKGQKILSSMEKTYGSEKKAKQVLYASKNAGKISGIDRGFYGHLDPNGLKEDGQINTSVTSYC